MVDLHDPWNIMQAANYPLLFFGDDHYSLTALKAILRGRSPTDSSIKAVVTRPPKPVGRKQTLTPSPIELFAKEHNIPVIHYDKNNLHATTDPARGPAAGLWSKLQTITQTPTLGILASFGYIIPKNILALFPYGIINIHPSLLPQYRGATPVQHAIALGDQATGVTLFKLTPKIDQGEILAQVKEPILPHDTTPTLTHRLFKKGSQLLIDLLQDPKLPHRLSQERFSGLPAKQPNLIYTRRFTRQTGFVPWTNFYAMMENQPLPAKNLQNPLLQLRIKHQNITSPTLQDTSYLLLDLARALHPWPGVWTILPAQAGTPTAKGPLRLKLLLQPKTQDTRYSIHISGKPKPIPWATFKRDYLPRLRTEEGGRL